jgi:hypothetical protein
MPSDNQDSSSSAVVLATSAVTVLAVLAMIRSAPRP